MDVLFLFIINNLNQIQINQHYISRLKLCKPLMLTIKKRKLIFMSQLDRKLIKSTFLFR